MINWKVRIRNKVFWITLIPLALLLVQQVLAIFGVTADFGVLQEQLIAVIGTVFAILALLGVIVDPTTEGVGDSENMAKRIQAATGIETRATIVGHIQRGGSPTAIDRYYGSIFGAKAVDLLLEGKSKRVIGYRKGEFIDYDINEALSMKKDMNDYEVQMAGWLVR